MSQNTFINKIILAIFSFLLLGFVFFLKYWEYDICYQSFEFTGWKIVPVAWCPIDNYNTPFLGSFFGPTDMTHPIWRSINVIAYAIWHTRIYTIALITYFIYWYFLFLTYAFFPKNRGWLWQKYWSLKITAIYGILGMTVISLFLFPKVVWYGHDGNWGNEPAFFTWVIEFIVLMLITILNIYFYWTKRWKGFLYIFISAIVISIFIISIFIIVTDWYIYLFEGFTFLFYLIYVLWFFYVFQTVLFLSRKLYEWFNIPQNYVEAPQNLQHSSELNP